MSRRKQSLMRAVRRGKAGFDSNVEPSLKNTMAAIRYYPDRPFSNKANTSERKDVHSRKNNELKKRIYAGISRFKKAVEATEEKGV